MRLGEMSTDDFDGFVLPFRLGGHGADGECHGKDGGGEMMVFHFFVKIKSTGDCENTNHTMSVFDRNASKISDRIQKTLSRILES